jgi:hypothetical protein
VADLLLQAWEDDFNKRQLKEPRPGKNRHGKAPVNGGRLKPLAEADFHKPLTAAQLATIFGTTPGFIEATIKTLLENKVLDPSLMLEPSATKEEGKTEVARLYPPLVAFHIGSQLDSPRGEEFRRSHGRLLVDYCLNHGKREIVELKERLAIAEAALRYSKENSSDLTAVSSGNGSVGASKG